MSLHEIKNILKLALCWLSVIPTADVYAAPDVRLTVYGRHTNDSVIELCPNDDDYTMVFHCSVTNSFSLFWSLPPFVNSSVTFSASNDLGQIDQSPVTLILTKRVVSKSGNENAYESELQVSTDALMDAINDANDRHLEVTCHSSNSIFQKMSMVISVRDPPEIISADMSETLMVMWSTSAGDDIVNIAVVARNTENGIERGVVVGREIRSVSIFVDTSLPYNVTVTVFDTCQQEFPSAVVLVKKKIISISPSEKMSTSMSSEMPQIMYTTSIIFQPVSPGPSPSQCVQETGSGDNVAIIGIIIVLLTPSPILWSMIYIIVLRKKLRKKYSQREGMLSPSTASNSQQTQQTLELKDLIYK